jgi:hypothetical protein
MYTVIKDIYRAEFRHGDHSIDSQKKFTIDHSPTLFAYQTVPINDSSTHGNESDSFSFILFKAVQNTFKKSNQ